MRSFHNLKLELITVGLIFSLTAAVTGCGSKEESSGGGASAATSQTVTTPNVEKSTLTAEAEAELKKKEEEKKEHAKDPLATEFSSKQYKKVLKTVLDTRNGYAAQSTGTAVVADEDGVPLQINGNDHFNLNSKDAKAIAKKMSRLKPIVFERFKEVYKYATLASSIGGMNLEQKDALRFAESLACESAESFWNFKVVYRFASKPANENGMGLTAEESLVVALQMHSLDLKVIDQFKAAFKFAAASVAHDGMELSTSQARAFADRMKNLKPAHFEHYRTLFRSSMTGLKPIGLSSEEMVDRSIKFAEYSLAEEIKSQQAKKGPFFFQ